MDGITPTICWSAIGGPCMETAPYLVFPVGQQFTFGQAFELSLWACPEHKDAAFEELRRTLGSDVEIHSSGPAGPLRQISEEQR